MESKDLSGSVWCPFEQKKRYWYEAYIPKQCTMTGRVIRHPMFKTGMPRGPWDAKLKFGAPIRIPERDR